jgi:hypothetical protein
MLDTDVWALLRMCTSMQTLGIEVDGNIRALENIRVVDGGKTGWLEALRVHPTAGEPSHMVYLAGATCCTVIGLAVPLLMSQDTIPSPHPCQLETKTDANTRRRTHAHPHPHACVHAHVHADSSARQRSPPRLRPRSCPRRFLHQRSRAYTGAAQGAGGTAAA